MTMTETVIRLLGIERTPKLNLLRERVANVIIWVGTGAAALIIAVCTFMIVVIERGQHQLWIALPVIAICALVVWLPFRALFYLLTGR
jgi:hypothetical protein